MIPATEATKQVQRLAGLDFFPRSDPAALKELRVAAEAAYTPEILTAVVDDWLASERECPKPADIRRMIWARQSPPEPRKDCPDCGGTGARIRWTVSWWKEEGSRVVRTRRWSRSEEEATAEAEALPKEAMARAETVAVDCGCRSTDNRRKQSEVIENTRKGMYSAS